MQSRNLFWKALSLLLVIAMVSTASCTCGGPIERSEIVLSMVVQPDRVNTGGEEYDITAFCNDDVTVDIYLANRGDADAQDVTAALNSSEGIGIDPIDDTFDFGSIEAGDIAIGRFSFSATNVTPGFHNLSLSTNYQDASGEQSLQSTVMLRVIEVGILNVTDPDYPWLFRTALDSRILGYSVSLLSNRSNSVIFTIKNGADQGIGGLSIDIEAPPESGITLESISFLEYTGIFEYATENVSVVALPENVIMGGDEKEFEAEIITEDVKAGIYPATLTMNYLKDGMEVRSQDSILVGVYDVDVVQEDLQNAVAATASAVSPRGDTFNLAIPEYGTSDLPSLVSGNDVVSAIKTVITDFAKDSSSTLGYDVETGELSIAELSLFDSAVFSDLSGHLGSATLEAIAKESIQKWLDKENANSVLEQEALRDTILTSRWIGRELFEEATDSDFIDKIQTADKNPSLYFEPTEITTEITAEEYSNLISPSPLIEIDQLDENQIEISVSKYKAEYQLEGVHGSLVLSSKETIHQIFEGGIDSFVVSIRHLKQGEWKAAYVTREREAPIVVSNTIAFNKTEQEGGFSLEDILENPPEIGTYRAEDGLDHKNKRSEIEYDKQDLSYQGLLASSEIFFLPEDTSDPEVDLSEVVFEEIKILSSGYELASNKTVLELEIKSKKDHADILFEIRTFTIFDEYHVSSFNISGGFLAAHQSQGFSIELPGKIGRDFDSYAIDVHGSPIAFATIMTVVGIITAIDWVIDKVASANKVGKADVLIQFPHESDYRTNIGDILLVPVEILYKPGKMGVFTDDQQLGICGVKINGDPLFKPKGYKTIPNAPWYKVDAEMYGFWVNRQLNWLNKKTRISFNLALSAQTWDCKKENKIEIYVWAAVVNFDHPSWSLTPRQVFYPSCLDTDFKKTWAKVANPFILTEVSDLTHDHHEDSTVELIAEVKYDPVKVGTRGPKDCKHYVPLLLIKDEHRYSIEYPESFEITRGCGGHTWSINATFYGAGYCHPNAHHDPHEDIIYEDNEIRLIVVGKTATEEITVKKDGERVRKVTVGDKTWAAMVIGPEDNIYGEKNANCELDFAITDEDGPKCGDGKLDPGEQCDPYKECAKACPRCPDCPGGAPLTCNEDCTCGGNCSETWCGDGIVQTPNDLGQNECCDQLETIEGGQCSEGQYCINCTCQTPTVYCGDGILSPGEECDPGNPAAGIPPVPCPEGQECTDDCQCESEYVYVEEVLEVGWLANWECSFYGETCTGCTVTIDFWGKDISSGGNYPVTNVVLKVNWAVKRDSGSISQSYYGDTYLYYDALYGDTIYIEARATDSVGEAIASGSLTLLE